MHGRWERWGVGGGGSRSSGRWEGVRDGGLGGGVKGVIRKRRQEVEGSLGGCLSRHVGEAGLCPDGRDGFNECSKRINNAI